jgi:phospholipid/cholesterol/gamma-HCH transport system substrate-binding protein
MNSKIVETITGFFVIAIALWFVIFFTNRAGSVEFGKNSYHLVAAFDQADGINVGSFIKIGGVKVGVVEEMSLDNKNYKAVLVFALDGDVKIAEDSIAKISSSGLLGEKYISIIPGADDVFLGNNEEIKFTESAVNLENLIGKMIYSGSDNKKNDEVDSSEKK